MDEGQLLLLWPGEVRRKREGDFGQIGPALLAGTNNCPSFINKISSSSYSIAVLFFFKREHVFSKVIILCTCEGNHQKLCKPTHNLSVLLLRNQCF